MAKKVSAEMTAEQGMVTIHAKTMRMAMPHLMPDSLRVAPTPMMAPVMVWVVETGMPEVGQEQRGGPGRLGAEPADGLKLGDLHPHRLDDAPAAATSCPTAMARWQDRMIQSVLESVSESWVSGCMCRAATSSATMMPMVFWASLPPCPSE